MNLLMYLLFTPILACSISQVLKSIFNLMFEKRKFKIGNLVADGNYPSSHTAFVTSITAIFWFNTISKWVTYGNAEIWIWCSIAITMLWLIVIRDALGMRYTVQKLCEAVTEIAKDTDVAEEIQKKLDIKSGHRPHEVIAGGILGLLIATYTSCIYYGWMTLMILIMVLFVVYIGISMLILKNKRK